MEVIYIEMPISIEQKKEYNRLGYRVVDAKFAPEDYELPEGLADPEPKKTRRSRRTETGE
jgi:hypothetical protein